MPLVVALAFTYLGYHAISGERGLYAFLLLSREHEAVSQDLDHVIAERMALERRTSRLRDDSLDLDLLDEEARKILGAGAANEVVTPIQREPSGKEE